MIPMCISDERVTPHLLPGKRNQMKGAGIRKIKTADPWPHASPMSVALGGGEELYNL